MGPMQETGHCQSIIGGLIVSKCDCAVRAVLEDMRKASRSAPTPTH